MEHGVDTYDMPSLKVVKESLLSYRKSLVRAVSAPHTWFVADAACQHRRKRGLNFAGLKSTHPAPSARRR